MTGSIYIHSYYTKSDNTSELKTSDTFTEQKLPTYNAPAKDAKVNTVTYYPNTVSGFKASAKTTNAIELTWNKVSNVDGYVLYTYDTTTKKWGRIAITRNNTSAVLGEITPDETTEFDMTTTCGALESMLFYVKSTCENSKVYFLLPHSIATSSRTNNLGLSYMDYKTAIEEICNKYDVVIIDCYNCNLTSDYTSTRNGVHTNGDNIHPTEAGYKKFYLPIVEETIEKSLMINE